MTTPITPDLENIKFNLDFIIDHVNRSSNSNNNSNDKCIINNNNKNIDNKEFYKKIMESIETIEIAFNQFKFEEIALSFNGGKDCCVLLHLINHVLLKKFNCNSNKSLKTIYFQTPNSFNQVNDFTAKCSTIYNLNLLEVSSIGIKEGLEKIITTEKIKAVFIGIRFGDPNSLHLDKFSFTDPGWPHFLRVNPILKWNYHEIWEFINICNIPYCELYEQGYTSIGQQHDTIPNPDLLIPETIDKYHHAHKLENAENERKGRGKNIKQQYDLEILEKLKLQEQQAQQGQQQ